MKAMEEMLSLLHSHTAQRFTCRAFCTFFCTLLGALAFAANAQAIQTHALDTAHSPFGTFNTPIGIAVDNSTNPADTSAGDVYVNDLGNNRVLKFDKNGTQIGGNFISGIESLAWNAVDPANGDLYVSTFGGPIRKFDTEGKPVVSFGDTVGGTDGVLHGRFTKAGNIGARSLAVAPATGDLYVADGAHSAIDIFDPQGTYITEFHYTEEAATDQIAVDGSGDIYVVNEHVNVVEYRPSENPPTASTTYDSGTVVDNNSPFAVEVDPSNNDLYIVESSTGLIRHFDSSGNLLETFPAPDGGDSAGLALNDATHTVYATDLGGTTANIYTLQPATPDVTTQSATEVQQNSATLHGHVDLDAAHGGGPITGCHLDYGTDTNYSLGSVPCRPNPASSNFTEATDVSGDISGLQPDTVYHFRLVGEDSNGHTNGFDATFRTLPNAPLVGSESVSNIRSDVAVMHAQVNPNDAVETYVNPKDGHATYHFEYVDDQTFQQDQPSGFEHAQSFPVPAADIGFGTSNTAISQEVGGLTPGAIYHYRVVAQTVGGTTLGAAHIFKTYTTGSPFDPCPNAHVRQQTGAAHLPDCRAYELVSATNTGGYPVESNLVSGQAPFGGYPQASSPSRVLYAVHDGGIPGTGQPTNRGPDPYVATRGKNGWATEYVGIPANDLFATAPFSSTLVEADPSLDTLAFGGATICSPCFADGSTGIPIHLPTGELAQGMSGPLDPGPSAKPDGYIAKRFSADGSHLVFGSVSKFAEGGNSDGVVSIYDRNLKTGETHVVSNSSEVPGHPLPCLQSAGEGECHAPNDSNGIAELAISKDGSRILVAQKVSEDANENVYWHLYMDINDSEKTIDLTPGATGGVLFDGMTEDGSKVFFTTKDALTTATNQDADESTDIYETEVSASGVTLTRISTGIDGTGNSDSCNPDSGWNGSAWNSVTGGACGVVAIGGGGGVASGNGTIYFLSPELLDGASNGTKNEPNLYVALPGQPPHFVATVDTTQGTPGPHHFSRNFGSFSNPAGVGVDNSGSASAGDVYIVDSGNSLVDKFNSAGTQIGEIDNSNTPGASFAHPVWDTVDPVNGDLYVGDLGLDTVQKFDPAGNLISSFGDSTPNPDGQLRGLETPQHSFAPGGLAINSTNGDLYVGDRQSNNIDIFDSSGKFITQFSPSITSTIDSIAVNASGDVYVDDQLSTVKEYKPSENPPTPSTTYDSGTLIDSNSPYAVGMDSTNGDLYVTETSPQHQIQRFDSSGNPIESFGSSEFGDSPGIAVSRTTRRVYASVPGSAERFDPPNQNPVVADAVNAAEVRHLDDFQVSPNGEFAAFPSALPLLPTVDNNGHTQIYRYDASTQTLSCVSCNPTLGTDTGDGTLSNLGLGLTDDGRVFFDSTQPLAARDEDEKTDVYEWEPQGAGTPQCESASGCVGLISTGISRFDARLLGVSADGTDAYFFTRDTLVPQDENGTLTKIYDARAGGGFPYIPPPGPCQASDECHGPSSQAPPSPVINTLTGSLGRGNSTGGHVRRKPHNHRRGHHKRTAHRHRRGNR